MSDELINEEEQFLALLEEEAKEIAEKEAEAVAETVEAPAAVEATPVVEEAAPVVEDKPVKTPKTPKVEAPVVEDNNGTVAIHSTRNVNWNGVGKVVTGYNIVTKAQADKWLTRNHVRLATPDEVAKEFGL